MNLCHPVGKALAAANNANIQFNSGEMAAQNKNQNQTNPTGHTKNFCFGKTVLPIMVLNDMTFTCKKCGISFEDKEHYKIHKGVHKHTKSRTSEYG